MGRGLQVSFECSPAVKARLEALAAERKLTQAEAIRAAILESTWVGERPSYEECLDLLGEQARVGNVPAIKELMAYYDRQSAASADPRDGFDELAARRSA